MQITNIWVERKVSVLRSNQATLILIFRNDRPWGICRQDERLQHNILIFVFRGLAVSETMLSYAKEKLKVL